MCTLKKTVIIWHTHTTLHYPSTPVSFPMEWTLAAKTYDGTFPPVSAENQSLNVSCACGAGNRCVFNNPHTRIIRSGYNDDPANIFFGGSVFLLSAYDTRRPNSSANAAVVVAPPVLGRAHGADAVTLTQVAVRYLRKLHMESSAFYRRPPSITPKRTNSTPSPPQRRSHRIQRAFWR